jgi:NADPH:quinone reductase-like Zn-dependent oxidoreductase
MKTMKALRFEKYGPPSVLSLEELRVPDLELGEALVELHASAVNPSDVKNVAGVFKASLPRVPGRDYAGVVAAGDGWKGKEVWGSGAGLGVTRDGTHAQYLIAELDSLSEKPSLLSMEEASAVGVPYLAAWSALVRGGHPGRRNRPDHRRSWSGRPGGYSDRALEKSESDRFRYFRQSFRSRCIRQREEQGSLCRGEGVDGCQGC